MQLNSSLLAGKEDAVVVLEVPNIATKAITGQTGSIQAKCRGCHVSIAPDTDSNGTTRRCTLIGNPKAVERARDLFY